MENLFFLCYNGFYKYQHSTKVSVLGDIILKIQTFPVGPMGTNCYFLINENSRKAVIVDPGANAPKILEKIKEKGLNVQYILLTHGHFDHTMALTDLREALHVPVYIHEYDNEMLSDPKKSMLSTFSSEQIIHKPAEVLLHDGDTIPCGDESIRVMHTPGHTKGSCCFITPAGILSGDTLFDGAAGRYDFYGGNFDALLHSIGRLRDLEGDYKIYPGHGSSSYLSTERNNNPYMQY